MAGFAPQMLLAMGTRLAGRVPQHTINTVTTNVPGPQFPLCMLGHQMIEAYPFIWRFPPRWRGRRARPTAPIGVL